MELIVISPEDLRKLIREEYSIWLQANTKPDNRTDHPGEAPPAFVSKREAARLLSCSQSTLDNFARSGRITRHYIGKAVRFDRMQVLSLAKGHTTKTKK